MSVTIANMTRASGRKSVFFMYSFQLRRTDNDVCFHGFAGLSRKLGHENVSVLFEKLLPLLLMLLASIVERCMAPNVGSHERHCRRSFYQDLHELHVRRRCPTGVVYGTASKVIVNIDLNIGVFDEKPDALELASSASQVKKRLAKVVGAIEGQSLRQMILEHRNITLTNSLHNISSVVFG